MPGIERDVGGTHLAVNWPGGAGGGSDANLAGSEANLALNDARVQRALDYAAALALRLSGSGHPARRIDLELRLGRLSVQELLVRGDVPGLAEADFVSLARATLNTPAAGQPAPIEPTVLWARLATAANPAPAAPRAAIEPDSAVAQGGRPPSAARSVAVAVDAPVRSRGVRVFGRSVPLGKILVALVAGGALGVLGLPRIEVGLPQLPAQFQPQTAPALKLATPEPQAAGVQARPTLVEPQATTAPASGTQATAAPATGTQATGTQPTGTQATVAQVSTAVPSAVLLPSPTSVPTLVSTPAPPLFAARFVSPLPNWPNNPDGSAWFGDGAFRLITRQPGRFVTVGVPLAAPVGNAIISAQFHKVGGAPGGGYGLIVRDQGTWSEGDTGEQPGDYIVLEVGDRGEVGIWQRSETRWIDIVPWTHAEAVRLDQQPNALAITLRDGSMRFEVNGELVASVIYNALPPTGGVGVFAGGDFNDVALEWLRIDTLHN